jgi:hypothetical protein
MVWVVLVVENGGLLMEHPSVVLVVHPGMLIKSDLYKHNIQTKQDVLGRMYDDNIPPIQRLPGAVSLGVKQPVREADHSPLSSAEVKNA